MATFNDASPDIIALATLNRGAVAQMVVKERVYTDSDLAVRWRRSGRTIQRWRNGSGGKLPQPDVVLPSGRAVYSDSLVEVIEQGKTPAT